MVALPKTTSRRADIGTLLNLACLKHTGQTLPVNWGGSPEWSYTLDPDSPDKKIAKYNKFASRLLLNPTIHISDSHPIEQKIKRAMITDEINKVFLVKITSADIWRAMKRPTHAGLGDTFTSAQSLALKNIRDSMLPHINLLIDADGYDYSRGVCDKFKDDDCYDPPTNHHYDKFIAIILVSNATNPYIREILKTMKADKEYNNTRSTKKILKIIGADGKRPDGEFVVRRPIDNSQRYQKKAVFQGDKLSMVETMDSICPVSRKLWYAWWLITIATSTPEDRHRGVFRIRNIRNDNIRISYRRRSNAKTDWWDYIKKESGSLALEQTDYPDKETHEERLINSIFQQ